MPRSVSQAARAHPRGHPPSPRFSPRLSDSPQPLWTGAWVEGCPTQPLLGELEPVPFWGDWVSMCFWGTCLTPHTGGERSRPTGCCPRAIVGSRARKQGGLLRRARYTIEAQLRRKIRVMRQCYLVHMRSLQLAKHEQPSVPGVIAHLPPSPSTHLLSMHALPSIRQSPVPRLCSPSRVHPQDCRRVCAV